MFKAFIHPAPMKRHNKSVVSAKVETVIVPPGSAPPLREPGLYFDIKLGDGRSQLLHVPLDQIEELRLAVAMLDAAAAHQ